MSTEPRILTLTGTPHPKALVQSLDHAAGTLVFAWLDADGKEVDSGGSIARFTPPAPLPQEEDYTGPVQYPEVDDAVLAAAIENPPAPVVPVPASVTRRQLLLVLNANGVTRAAVRAMLAGNEAALIEFDEASEFRRDHPLVGQLGTALSMSAGQIDAMFVSAALL